MFRERTIMKNFKKQFEEVVSKQNTLSESSSYNTPKKNLSWSNFDEDDCKSKRAYRCTPYPLGNPLKRKKMSNSTPKKILTFNNSDMEEYAEDSFTNDKDISELCQSKKQGTKRKRNKNIGTSEWTVTSCNKIKPDKCNKSYNTNNAATTSEEFSNETVRLDENNSKENNLNGSSNKGKENMFDFCTSEDGSSDSEVEQIFKPKISNINECKVIKTHVELPLDYLDEQISTDTDKSSLVKNPNELDDNSVEQEVNECDIKKSMIKFKHFFNNVVKPYITDDFCILFVKHSVKLYFYGKLSVTVLWGAVEVLGHVLKYDNGKEHEMYSPRGNSFLCLETMSQHYSEDLHTILSKYMSKKEIKRYQNFIDINNSILMFRNLNNSLTNYLSKHVAQFLFPKSIECKKLVEKKMHCLFEIDEFKWNVYRKNENWPDVCKTALNNLNKDSSCTVLCGGKSVGKSVLLRYMVNYLLKEVDKVVCIDLDIGQAEFTIGGCVSVTIVDEPIFGPNFTHLKKPVKSFFVGDVNVVNCVDRYISSVKKLLNYCNENISKDIPWIVNLMGFSRSIGIDLTVSIIKLINPSTVVQINSNVKHRNYHSLLSVEYVKNFIYSFPIILSDTNLNYDLKVLESVAEEKVEGTFQFESRHIREMSILSYFSELVSNEKELTSVAPYGIKLSSVKLFDFNYSEKNIPATLNGNLVALCKVIEDDIDKQAAVECFGFGIVRGIDLNSEELYLVTPVREDELDNVNCLIRGNINLPPSLYMIQGRQGLVPYILLGTQEGTGTIPKRTYINLKRLLMKQTCD